MQFTLHARIYLHAEVTHATFLHAHTRTNMHTVLYACVYTHIFIIGGKERRALHLAQSLC